VKLPFSVKDSFSLQNSSVLNSRDKPLAVPIETIIEDIMEDPEHFINELN
jgi:hypothetical protein